MKERIYSKGSTKVRTTVDLPSTVQTRMEQALDQGIAQSEDELIVQAVEHYLDEFERAWMDEQFIAMAQDKPYQALQQKILKEFEPLDWESWDLTDVEYDDGRTIKRGEIYWVRLDRMTSEQVIARPVVIISGNEINRLSSVVVTSPLVDASEITRHYPNDVPIYAPEGGLGLDSVLFVAQIHSIAKSRLGKRVGRLAPESLERVNHALKMILDL